MIGMEFPTDALGYEVAKGLFDKGCLVAGTLFSAKTIRIEPPLTLTQQEMNMAIETIEKVFKEVNAKHFENKRIPVRK
jgi:putrescine aminotransferase